MKSEYESSLTDRVSEAIFSSVMARNVVLFCGAGISMDPPATLPDWKAFRDETIKAVASRAEGLPKVLPHLLNREMYVPGRQGLAPEVVASQIRIMVPDYFLCLTALDHDQWNLNHELIAHLARVGHITQIVTTNFDQLIEKALTSLDVMFQVYRSEEDFARRADRRSTAGVEVFKLHGCLSDPNTIVATVEQEAVGLSPAKTKVMRQLWTGRTAIFWGYSGADLKVRQDYLQIAASAPVMRGVFWVPHSTSTWQEKPLPELRRLMETIREKGVIHYCKLPQILMAALESEGNSFQFSPPTERAEDVRRRRNTELVESIQRWAGTSLQPYQSLEIFAQLLERVGELPLASLCYDHLSRIEVREEGEVSLCHKASANTYGAALLYRLGDVGRADQLQRIGEEWVVSVGSIDLLIISTRTRAEILTSQGHVLWSIQPRAFSHYISRWATRKGKIAALELGLNTIDFLLTRGLVKEAEKELQALEQEACDAGLLEILSHALALRSRLHILLGEESEAIKYIREAEDLVITLGLEGDAQLLRFRRNLLEVTLGGSTSETTAEILDDVLEKVKNTSNRLLASALVLDVLDNLQIDPHNVLDLLGYVTQYTEEDDLADVKALSSPLAYWPEENKWHDFKVRVSLHKARAYRQLADATSELAVIEDIFPQLQQSGYENIAAELYARFAQLKQEAGCSSKEALGYFEHATFCAREAGTFSKPLEEKLALLRVELGIAQYPDNYSQVISDWLKEGVLIADVLRAFMSHLPNANELLTDVPLNVGEILESQFGKAGRFTWSLWGVARICNSIRREGQAELALEITNRSLPMARQLGDSYLTGVFHNLAGLDLSALGRTEEALKQYEFAIKAGEQTADNQRLVHYYYNAALSNADLGRFDAALGFYARLAPVVSQRQDLTAFRRLSLGAGEALKALGRNEEAKGHLENARYCAWVTNDQDLMIEVNQQLGKIHWDLKEYHNSIAYRIACKKGLERKGRSEDAAMMTLLVANTYDQVLGRAVEAIHYYEEVLALLNKDDKQINFARERLRRCKDQPRKIRPWLFELLKNHADSEEAVEPLAIQLAMHTGKGLWHFEVRSWTAWAEDILPPVLVGNSMLTLSRSARALREHERAVEWINLAKRLTEYLGDFEGSEQLKAEIHKELKSTESLDL